MTKKPLSSTIMGIFLTLGGIVLIILGIFGSFEASWWVLIYGIPMFIIGIVLLFWKREDEIEQRKDLVKGGNKK